MVQRPRARPDASGRPHPQGPLPLPRRGLTTRLTAVLLAITLGLQVISLIAQYDIHVNDRLSPSWADVFDASGEGNLPTFFSALLLLTSSAMLWVVAARTRRARLPHANRWELLALLFLLFAIDEVFQLHELADPPLSSLLGTDKVIYFPFIVIALVAALLLVRSYEPFVRSLPRLVREHIVLAAALYAAGALVLEGAGRLYFDLTESYGLGFAVAHSLFEMLEMLGIVVFIRALQLQLAVIPERAVSPQ